MPLGLLSVQEDGSLSYLTTFQNPRLLTLSHWSLGFSMQFLRNRNTGPQKGHRLFCFCPLMMVGYVSFELTVTHVVFCMGMSHDTAVAQSK